VHLNLIELYIVYIIMSKDVTHNRKTCKIIHFRTTALETNSQYFIGRHIKIFIEHYNVEYLNLNS